MAKSIPALVTPDVLVWARKLDDFSVNEIAQKMKVKDAKIEAWENGAEYPTLVQAKSLAKQYRVPFAYFYLPDVPRTIKRLEKIDYRTFGNWGPEYMSRDFRWFQREIEERRDTMLDLYKEAEITPQSLTVKLNNITAESFAVQLRQFLNLTPDVQHKFRKPEAALSYCISKLEAKDFLVFQAAKIDPSEMRGLSIAYDVFPIIALNRKDENSARLFTLFHELVHILTRTSGICNDFALDTAQANQLELYCNKVAGLALVPTDVINQNKNIDLIKQYGVDDTYINALARDFAVSREVILHRLWDCDVIDRKTYFDILNRYNEEYKAYKSKKKNEGFLPPALDKGTQVGKLYTRTVMNAYYAERLTPRETSNYLLNLRIQHFEAVERWCY